MSDDSYQGGGDHYQEEEEEEDEEFALAQELATATTANDDLALENALLEAYVSRISPELFEMRLDESPSRRHRRGKDSASFKKDRALTFEEKTDIAAMEIDYLHKRTHEVREVAEKEIDDLQSEMEAVDTNISETKKDTYEFKRDIIVGAENPRTGKTMAEKMLRFLEDRLRVRDVMAEKLRLKNSSVKLQIVKMEQQLHQKEEMGEVLHVIDFDQLKIENQQYLEKIEERNNELLRMKLSTGRTIQMLNTMKNRLSELVTESEALRKDIAEREAILGRFGDDMDRVKDGRQKAVKAYKTQKMEAEDTDRPQVMEYILLTAEVQNLAKQVSDWERKLEIADMEEKRTRKMYRTMAQSMQGMAPSSKALGDNAGGLH
mmetsp:Transcript_32019/g.80168  ORF Transcript_32019/g.80168 Transcript_32019/m.80168 type:complete len:376 (+) Transcript_32019:159-1286(+)